jgi:hypothetical protein
LERELKGKGSIGVLSYEGSGVSSAYDVVPAVSCDVCLGAMQNSARVSVNGCMLTWKESYTNAEGRYIEHYDWGGKCPTDAERHNKDKSYKDPVGFCMIKDINELMSRVNCKKWHKDWEEYFDKAVKVYSDSGCIYSKYCYYEMLENKYSMIGEFLPLYKKATELVDGDEAFELFLVFMSIVLNERANVRQELSEFVQPVSPENKDDTNYYRETINGEETEQVTTSVYRNVVDGPYKKYSKLRTIYKNTKPFSEDFDAFMFRQNDFDVNNYFREKQ